MNFLKRLQKFSDYCYDANVDNVGFAMSIVIKDKARHIEVIEKAKQLITEP